MPTLQLKIAPAQPPERHALLARRLTAITAEILGKRAVVTAVMIEELPPARWFVGAEPPAEATAWLEISITQGTNTADQKQAFVAAAHAELQQQLGPLAQASYVIVRELPATDWGYGGRTQAERAKEKAR